jgi:hypothetical protein
MKYEEFQIRVLSLLRFCCDIGRKIWRCPKWWFRQKEPVARLTGWLAAFTACLVMVSVLQWCTLKRTDETILRTLEIQRLEQRAWVQVVAPRFQAPLTIDHDQIKTMMDFSVKNVGKLPAQDVSLDADILMNVFYWRDAAAGKETEKDYEILESSCKRNSTTKQAGVVVFPGEEILLPPRMMMTEDWRQFKEFERTKNWRASLSLIGCLRYRSGLDDEVYHTIFNYIIVNGDPTKSEAHFFNMEQKQVDADDLRFYRFFRGGSVK